MEKLKFLKKIRGTDMNAILNEFPKFLDEVLEYSSL